MRATIKSFLELEISFFFLAIPMLTGRKTIQKGRFGQRLADSKGLRQNRNPNHPRAPGGGVEKLPYLSHIGMCLPIG